jgi:hypothetical protein
MNEIELTNVLKVMQSLWPGTNDGDVMALNDLLRAVPTKAMAVAALKRVACQKAYRSCPRPEISSALSGLTSGVGNLVHVYALRGDGKWTDCQFECNDTNHAANKMHLRLDGMYGSRDGFSLYIGEENFPAFSKARSEIFNAMPPKKRPVIADQPEDKPLNLYLGKAQSEKARGMVKTIMDNGTCVSTEEKARISVLMESSRDLTQWEYDFISEINARRPISTTPKSTQASEKTPPMDERTKIRADVGVGSEKVEHRASSCEIANGIKNTLVTADKVEKIEQFRDLMTK